MNNTKSLTKQNHCGIVTIECSAGKEMVNVEDVASLSGFSSKYLYDKLDFKKKFIATSTENPSDLAIEAAKKLFQCSSLKPKNIDFLIYCSNGIFDYQFWSPSAFIQKAIGATKAITFEINNGCNAPSLGLFLGSNLLKTEKNWKYGLLIISDTLSKFINYQDEKSFPLFSISDGAAAVLIAANHDKNLILAHSFYTDGKYANCNLIYDGGTKKIFRKTKMDHYIKMLEKSKINLLRYNVMAKNYIRVANNVMNQLDIQQQDIKYLITNQNSKSVITDVIKRLGIDEKNHVKTSQGYGHMGGVDIFLGMKKLQQNQLLQKNDLILALTAGIGFHWGAQIIKI